MKKNKIITLVIILSVAVCGVLIYESISRNHDKQEESLPKRDSYSQEELANSEVINEMDTNEDVTDKDHDNEYSMIKENELEWDFVDSNETDIEESSISEEGNIEGNKKGEETQEQPIEEMQKPIPEKLDDGKGNPGGGKKEEEQPVVESQSLFSGKSDNADSSYDDFYTANDDIEPKKEIGESSLVDDGTELPFDYFN